ncbi:hypothetical protein INT43_001314 [Umbelopsis isabellina]|uniref:RanBD1 domain-containing protein n=1 Tax=Mortierella isabellina TaxID=91625 RepID=A0A8H7PKE9_MORIS|nr:hypothetical protein INT43_001314 [Umbelopsis isabellina]
MSSPPEATGFDDAATRKRERATSVDPAPAEHADDNESVEKQEIAKAPVKKTKHAENTSVRTIRKNFKDMKTTDMTWATTEEEPEGGEDMHTETEQHEPEDVAMNSYNDKKRGPDEVTDTTDNDAVLASKDASATAPLSPRKKARDADDTEETSNSQATDSNVDEDDQKDASAGKKGSFFAQFAGKPSGSNGDDWGDFAEESDVSAKDKEEAAKKPQPKYAFGASSGFGSKGWGAVHQTAPVTGGSAFGTTGKSGFGGFGSSAFGSSTTSSSQSSTPSNAPSFSSFANSTASPFALLAAKGSTSNALASHPKKSSSEEKDQPKSSKSDDDSDGDDSGDEEGSKTSSDRGASPKTFGVEPKVRVPVLKPQELTTGEEDEYTVHSVKAKLLVIDGKSENWKERGTGTLRINTKKTNGTSATRLIMRADSVFRVILNVPLFPGMKVWIMQEKFVRFAAFEQADPSEDKKNDDSSALGSRKLVNYAVKVASSSSAQDLYDMIIAHLPRSE